MEITRDTLAAPPASPARGERLSGSQLRKLREKWIERIITLHGIVAVVTLLLIFVICLTSMAITMRLFSATPFRATCILCSVWILTRTPKFANMTRFYKTLPS